MDTFYMPSLLASSITAVCVFLVALLSRAATKQHNFNVPTVGLDKQDAATLKARFVSEADVVLKEGYKQFEDKIFQVLTPDGPRLFLPRVMADDLKKLPRNTASGMKALSERLIGHYTTIDHESPVMLGVLKIDLNRNLGNFVGAVEAEVDHCFQTQFPPCDDWTPIDLQDKLARIVAQASARIFVGLPLCRSDEWLACSTKFATDVMIGGETLKRWHPWLRPLAQYWIPEVTQIQNDHRRARELIRAELERRRRVAEGEASVVNEGYGSDARYTMTDWMYARAEKLGDKSFDDKELANLQMLIATAAIHTTRLAIIHALFDLAARPEYIEPLREEILEVTRDNGGVVQKQHLTMMKKLDSFMKESARHSPASVATFQRKLLAPVELSNGFRIPAGVVAQVNTHIFDDLPTTWEDRHGFDGFRFYKMRQQPEDANKFQFSSVSYNSMEFGYGNDACPGRFFASNQIKIILSYILRHYEIKFGDEVMGRPKNPMFEVNVMSDPTTMMYFKKRG